MHYNTQNEKLGTITEKTLVVGIDVGSEMHYARTFYWRGYVYSKKAFSFSNAKAGFNCFLAWMHELGKKHDKQAILPGMEPLKPINHGTRPFQSPCKLKKLI